MKRTARIAIAGATAASLAVLAGCAAGTEGGGGGGESERPTSVSLGTGYWIGYGPWHIAESEGYFAENSIEVEQTVVGATDRIASFASGDVVAANFGIQSAYVLAEQGIEFKIVLLQDYSLEADGVLAGPGIETPADLAGRRVAYEAASTSEIMAAATLEEGGLTLEDVEAVPMGAGDGAAAVIAGQVDAAVTYEPYITPALEENPDLAIIFTAADEPGMVSDVLLVRDDFIESNPAAVEALVTSWGQAIDFYGSDTETAQGIIAEGVGEEPESLATGFAGVRFFALDEALVELSDGEYVHDVMPMMVQRSAAAGMIESADLDHEELIETRFLEAAVE